MLYILITLILKQEERSDSMIRRFRIPSLRVKRGQYFHRTRIFINGVVCSQLNLSKGKLNDISAIKRKMSKALSNANYTLYRLFTDMKVA